MENIDVRITQYPRKTVVSDFDIFLIADVTDIDVVTGFPKYKKVMAKDLPSIVNTASDITYADLLAKALEGELSVGEFYNITDSTSGIAPILVQAVSDSAIGYLAFDGDNPLLTVNYDFITDTVRWSKDQDSEPVALDSFSAVTPLSYDDVTGVFTISQSSATTNGYLSATDWATFSAKQNALSGTGLVKSTSGTISYITDSSSNWDSAYNDTITSAAVTGTTSKLLTLTQRDGGTITASWGDLNSVTSVFGRTGAITAQTGDYTTTQVTEGTNLYYTQDRFNSAFSLKSTTDLTEGTNLYYTDLRARGAFSETVTGLTYNPTSGVLSTTSGYGIPTTSSQSNWDTAYTNRITSASAPLSIAANAISISQASSTTDGYLSSGDWSTFNAKQPAGDYITALSGEATATGPNNATVTLSNSAVTGKTLTGLNITGGSVSSSDSILAAFGKVQNQINGLIGGTIYQGTWDASINDPFLESGVGVQGHYYIVNVAGNTNLDGITDWNLGDWAIYDGSAWQQVDNTDAVVSVNGQTGVVSLSTTNIAEGTNLYFTQTRVSANSDVAANTAARHSAVTLGTASGLSLSGQQLSLGLSSASTTGALSSSDWSTFNSKQAVLSGNGIVKSTGGTITYVTDNSPNWNTAYNDMIDSAAVTGTTTKTLTLYQQDGGTITTTWTDENTNIVTSVFGRIGDVTAQSGDYTTTQITEGDNLYFTQTRVSANTDVAANTAARHNAVTLGTANGLSLSTQQLSLGLSSSTTNGALSSTDWTTFNNKQNALGFTPEPAITAGTTAQYWRGDKSFQTLDTSVVPENTNLYYTSTRFNTSFATKTTSDLTEGTNLYYTDARARAAITLTTTGTSGVATYVGGTLNIPDYGSALGAYLPLSGGTLTGALYGTTATFSGVVSAKGSAPYYQWLNASDVRLAYIQHNGSDLVISTDTGDIVLAPTGKVGIKNDAPSQNLTVGDGTGTGNQYVRIFASASDIYIGQSGGTLFGQSANSAGYVLSDNISFPFVLGTIAAQDLIFGTNNTARITINGSTGALTATSSITASSFVKSGGTSSQALLADGSVGTFSASNWNTAYNDSIVSAAVTGTSTKTLTLNQQDGGTVTASWSDIDTGLTSVGLSMPSAFSVSNSPLTSNGTIAVTGAGTTAQYVRGDGSLATFPSVAAEAQTLITEVYNETGATLTKGTVVYINGGHGNLPTITKALANSDATSAQTYGVVQNDITDNNNGFVVVIGSLTDISTNGYPNGTILYLSPTTAGQWTSTKPYAPQHIVYVGIVVREHPTQGVVEIKIQNGYEMDELHNVSAQSPANGDILQFNYSTQLWTKTAGTTSAISEGSNLYYTDARARAAITGTSPISVSSGVVSISQSSGSTNGYLSSTDWTTFNAKQPAGNYITALTGEATASGPNSASVTLTNSAVIGKVLTGLNVTGGSVSATDSILAAFGKVQNQINGLIGGSIYQSVWNASTNSPTLASGVGTKGYYYIVNVAGSTNLDGITDWKVGDWAIYDGTAWQKVDNTDAVSSVNGQTGAVSLTTSNISEGSNLYYTAARFNSAFSGKTTTDLTEGTNLYYTSTRFDSAFSAKTTSNLTEGSNLYYTAARFNSAFSGKSTSDLAEGTNLYYTDARARAAISLTTTGTSGAATYSGGVLNIPQYQAALTNPITGTGTTNYLPKFTGTSALGNSLIYDNGTNVGIGTTTPSQKLTIGNGTGTGNQYVRIVASGSDIYIGQSASTLFGQSANSAGYVLSDNTSFPFVVGTIAAQSLIFGTNTAERMRIFSDGNVAINSTTNAGYKLDVNGTARVSGALTAAAGLNNTGSASDTWATGPSEGLAIKGTASGGQISTISTFLDTTSLRIGAGVSQKTGILINGQTSGAGSSVLVSTGGATRLTIASTGVATFNSGTTNQNTTISGSKVGMSRTSDGAEVVYFSKNTDLGTEGTANIQGYNGIQFRTQGAESVKLTIAESGAATFSSSVTATSFNGNATTATNISNAGTVTLATATESNSIYITQPSYTTDQPVKLLNFAWYSDVWQMGNIRTGGASSAGFGIYLSGTEKVRIGTDGRISNLGWSTTGRNYSSEWIEFPNYTGLYSSNNGAHFYPNNGSYGSWMIAGGRNGWGGLEFDYGGNGNISLMISGDSNTTGFHNNSYGWQFLWQNGTLYVFKNAYGAGTQATVLDSVNYGSYALPLSGGNLTGLVQSTANIEATTFRTDGYFELTSALRGLKSNFYATQFYPSSTSYWNVTSSSSATVGALLFRQGYEGTTKGYVYWNSDGFGLLNNTGGWSVRLNYGGSMGGTLYGSWGVGGASPVTALDVIGGAYSNTTAKFGASKPVYLINDDPHVGFNTYYNSGWLYGAGSSGSYAGTLGYTSATGDFAFRTSATFGNANNAVSLTTLMTLKQNSNVGINTTAPTNYSGYTTLHVNGKSTGGGGLLRLTTSDSSIAVNIYTNNNGAIYDTTTAHPHYFNINGASQLIVSNDGITTAGSIITADPGTGSAPWKLGDVQSEAVALVTNQYIEVEINGVYYRLALVEPA